MSAPYSVQRFDSLSEHWAPIEHSWEVPTSEFTYEQALALAVQQSLHHEEPIKIVSSEGYELMVEPEITVKVSLRVGETGRKHRISIDEPLENFWAKAGDAFGDPDSILGDRAWPKLRDVKDNHRLESSK